MRVRNNYVAILCVSIFVILQIWCSYITFRYPYIGIHLVYTNQQWMVEELNEESASESLDVKIGDIIKQVDGRLPDEFPIVEKYKAIEQARTLLISRDGREHEIVVDMEGTIAFDIPLIQEIICLFMALLLFMKMRRSPSARLLAAFFLSAAIIFMSLGASIRGDTVGKLLITSFMMALPVVFLHFLIVFFKEKGDIQLSDRILKYLYAIVILAVILRSTYFSPFVDTVYRYDGSVTFVFFIIGFVISMSVLTTQYKIRKQQSYASGIIKSVWWSWLISFLPIITLSFLPKLLVGYYLINTVYTSCIVLLFPISFAYLIASNQLYDIGLVVRRFIFAGLLAILPVSLFTGAYAFLFQHMVDKKQIVFVFSGYSQFCMGSINL